ncbi:MAG: uroporphyrinogen-III synthase [Methanothermobacter sp.]|uniref:Uroporphyrinogen-III synthase n=2 Tax=Methanobacteriaceae TaxID=2159 RepID=A0A371NCE7_9EURY|nr:uroporphyrinogen-III synthase [Methanothermobacter sp.]MDN5373816.1 uroporphyrinogen-III synthase [Methanothermobacter sp.]REE25315.1 uroporphyrinogen-III synthase [Methanothermobacter defluvii]BAZ98225.1 hypothetical protein tca_00150 [Methanothermobacter sp. EMTCatA1]
MSMSTVKLEGLRNRTVAVTRPPERSAEAVELIEGAGGRALVAPTLELKEAHTESLREVCRRADEWDLVIFTSQAAVESLFQLCREFAGKIRKDCLVAVIGPRTARVAGEHGLRVDIVPEDYTAEGLLDALTGLNIEGWKVALPRTLSARKVLPRGLEMMGAEVLVAEAYRSGLPEDTGPAEELIDGLLDGKVDAVTFTSPLTVENLFKIAGNRRKELIEVLKRVKVAAIGPITLRKLEEHGITAVTPERYTVKDMIAALAVSMGEDVD